MRRMGLVLVDESSEFQQLLANEAAAAASSAGLELDVRAGGVGGYELGSQLRLIDRWLGGDDPPDALLVLAARDRGLARVVRDAAARGIHWVGLNRTEDDLDAVRRSFPSVAVATVCPDETATGRIQAEITRTLVPHGARVLYVTGHLRSLTARDRSEGFHDGTAGHCEVTRLEAGWAAADASEAIGSWLRVALRARRRLDAVVCQTDALADVAVQALAQTATELGREALSRIPVVGCDGTPGYGQALVDSGRLAATVVLPRTAATAIHLLASALSRGTTLPAFSSLAGRPWPEVVSPLSLPA